MIHVGAGSLLLVGLGSGRSESLRSEDPTFSILEAADAKTAAETVAAQQVDLVLTRGDLRASVMRQLEIRGLAHVSFSTLPWEKASADALGREIETARLKARVAELETSQRTLEDLAVLGRLCAGILHEVANALDAARRFLNLGRREEIPVAERDSDLKMGLQAIDRAAEVLRSTLTFSRGTVVTDPPRPLHAIVAEVLRFTETPERSFSLKVALEPTSRPVPGVLAQVLLNLVRNAINALDSRGEVRITARSEGELLRLVVEDTGRGFTPELSEKIFEPYFRADTERPGTGLGLALSRRLLERVQGTLRAESRGPGQGARFTVVIPFAAGGNP